MSDKPDAFLPLYGGDFLKHISRIDRAAIGSYVLLIIDIWTMGPVPDDDAVLARVAKCSEHEWSMTRAQLEPYFRIEGGFWRQKRVEEEFEKAMARKAKASKAAKARWAKRRAAQPAAKDAPSIKRARSKQMLAPCPSPSQSEGEAKEASPFTQREASPALRGPADFPPEKLARLIERFGEPWAKSYIVPCRYNPETGALVPPTKTARIALQSDAGAVLAALGLSIGTK